MLMPSSRTLTQLGDELLQTSSSARFYAGVVAIPDTPRLSREEIENSPVGKDLEVVADGKLTMSQQ